MVVIDEVVYFLNIIPTICVLQFGEEVTTKLKSSLENLQRSDGQDPDSPAMMSTVGTQLFELYLALQEFCKFKEHLPNRYGMRAKLL